MGLEQYPCDSRNLFRFCGGVSHASPRCDQDTFPDSARTRRPDQIHFACRLFSEDVQSGGVSAVWSALIQWEFGSCGPLMMPNPLPRASQYPMKKGLRLPVRCTIWRWTTYSMVQDASWVCPCCRDPVVIYIYHDHPLSTATATA